MDSNSPTKNNFSIPDDHAAKLGGIIREYLLTNGIIGAEHLVKVHISAEPRPQVVVTSGSAPASHEEMVAILAEDSRKSFARFAQKAGLRGFYVTRISATLGDGSRLATVLSVAEHTESEMLRRRNYGRKCLRVTVEWLESLGLRFGMKFSDDLKAAVAAAQAPTL